MIFLSVLLPLGRSKGAENPSFCFQTLVVTLLARELPLLLNWAAMAATARITPHCRSSSGLATPPYLATLDKHQVYRHPAVDPAAAVLSPGERANSAPLGPSTGALQRTKRAGGDGDLDVFSAEKYFSGSMDPGRSQVAFEHGLSPRLAVETKEGVGGGLSPHGSPYGKAAGTPSVCSDLSANSRSSLLWAPPKTRRQQPGSPRRPTGKTLLGTLLRCNSCSRSNSVDAVGHPGGTMVDSTPKKDSGQQKAASSDSISSARSMSPTTAIGQIKREILLARGGGVNSRRQSREDFVRAALHLDLDDCRFQPTTQDHPAASTPSVISGVFGSPIDQLKRCSFDVQQKQMAKLSLDVDDDARSETSSELFEIESISTLVPRGTTISSTLSVTTPSCYEPSEASIEWDVVTASAANDCSELWGFEYPEYVTATKKAAKPNSSRPQGLFMGCASSRAVSVSNNAYKVPAERRGESVDGRVLPPGSVPKPVSSVENRLTATLKTAQAGRTWIVQPVSPDTQM